MNPLLGALNDYPLSMPGFEVSLAPAQECRRSKQGSSLRDKQLTVAGEERTASALAEVFPFPYMAILGSLVEEGKILEARNLLEVAGAFIPQDSKVRKVLAPPRIRRISERGFDRSAEIHWLKTNFELYRGKWVALLGEELIASAETLKELLVRVNEFAPARKPLVHHIE